MGMNRPGEMDILSGIVRPYYGVVTNVGTAHIGNLGSKDSIAEEKRKVFSYVPENGFSFVYEDDEYRDFLLEGVRGKAFTFGRRTTAGFENADSLGLSGYRIYYRGYSALFPLFGEHNLVNALCAISVTSELGVPVSGILQGLESVKPAFGRGEIVNGEHTVIIDCYNANEESMIHSIGSVKDLGWSGRKVLVLGSMYELGELSGKAHANVGEFAAQAGVDAVFFFGEEMVTGKTALDKAGFKGFSFATSNFDSLSKALKTYLAPGDLVLIKGSRLLELERLVTVLSSKRSATVC